MLNVATSGVKHLAGSGWSQRPDCLERRLCQNGAPRFFALKWDAQNDSFLGETEEQWISH